MDFSKLLLPTAVGRIVCGPWEYARIYSECSLEVQLADGLSSSSSSCGSRKASTLAVLVLWACWRWTAWLQYGIVKRTTAWQPFKKHCRNRRRKFNRIRYTSDDSRETWRNAAVYKRRLSNWWLLTRVTALPALDFVLALVAVSSHDCTGQAPLRKKHTTPRPTGESFSGLRKTNENGRCWKRKWF